MYFKKVFPHQNTIQGCVDFKKHLDLHFRKYNEQET